MTSDGTPPGALQLVALQYELALRIGQDLDLERMLALFLPAALQRLQAHSGQIWLHDPSDEEPCAVRPVATHPASAAERWNAIDPLRLWLAPGEAWRPPGPTTVTREAATLQILPLGARGALMLLRRGSALPPTVAAALVPVLARLETACLACLEHRRSERMRLDVAQRGESLARLVGERTAELLRAKEDAERANAAKSEFLTNMSHELRTPMHAILGYARLGLMKIDCAPPQKLRDYLEKIRDSGDRLMLLLNDLLDLAKLEAGQVSFNFQPNNPLQAMDRVVDELHSVALLRQVGLVREPLPPGEAALTVRGDPLRLEQVFRNVVGNALKFSPAGSTVLVRARRTTTSDGMDTVEFAVTDQGKGIPEQELEAVFDKFVQSSRTRDGSGGTGLGLAICRQIMTAHGGTIVAENNPDGGATFRIRLPRLHDTQTADAPDAAEGVDNWCI